MNTLKDYTAFCRQFYRLTGLDLSCYKDRQMERRVRYFMERSDEEDLGLFYRRLETDGDLRDRFISYLTINTSGFFRDAEVYSCLATDILPRLAARFGALKIWSAGCAAGEEPYSLAITLEELGLLAACKIVATDINALALARARQGCYLRRELENIPAELLARYFMQINADLWRINERLRACVGFRQDDLLNVAEHGCQLILCRNFFIYLKAGVQQKIIARFAALLPAGGYLVVGTAENILNAAAIGLQRQGQAIYCKK